MTDIIHYMIVQCLVMAVLAFPALLFSRRRDWRPVGLLLLYIVADVGAQVAPGRLGFHFGSWNWTGKVASILLSLGVVLAMRCRQEVGLRMPAGRTETKWTIVGIILCALFAYPAALLQPDRPHGIEVYAFEATLPGLDEELATRGIALLLLLRAFAVSKSDVRALLLAGGVTTLWFTSAHMIMFQRGQLHVDWHRLLDVMPYGILLTFIRLRSTSLLGGIIGHNVANVTQETLGAFGV